jgi:transcriptional regulator with XRE-family HTH domain
MAKKFARAKVLNATQLGCELMTGQLGIPCEVSPVEVMREKSLGGAIELCAKAAGYSLDKELQLALGVDKAQFSRWQSGQEGILWPKLRRLMEVCGNNAPVLWMAHDLGYDLHSLRRLESETERENRLLREENAALRRVLLGEQRAAA